MSTAAPKWRGPSAQPRTRAGGRSKSVQSSPCASRMRAAANPEAPAPTMATRRIEEKALCPTPLVVGDVFAEIGSGASPRSIAPEVGSARLGQMVDWRPDNRLGIQKQQPDIHN